MSEPDQLVAWCPNCGAVGPADARWLDHPRGCLQPKLEQVDRLTVVRWRRERKRVGWYPEDVDWLVGEVERLREQAELARELGDLLPRKELTITRLRGLLARLEWAGRVPLDAAARVGDCCPACDALEISGDHGSNCWLAAELKEHQP
jgi:hypothetical protein